MNPVLIDELTRPPLRAIIGRLLGAATEASIALTHVRLRQVDLTADETARVRRCRILLGGLDARAFDGLPPTPALEPLLHFIASPRVEIRSVGLACWSPDFSIYHGLAGRDGPAGDACLVGAHYFHEPPGGVGPALTCLLTDSSPVRLTLHRFEVLWEDSYDVRDTVLATIAQCAHAR